MAKLLLLAALAAITLAAGSLDEMRRDFQSPPVDCRPHTRWWWLGNALSKSDITWQLEQMRAQGIGGVEQITMAPVYERGNHPYLSPAFFDLARHAIGEAKRLGMEVSFNFGGPGWIWGGEWVPPEDRNQNLVASFADLEGPRDYSGPLPVASPPNPKDVPGSLQSIRPQDRLQAVIAGRIVDGRILEASLVDLTTEAKGRRLNWKVPAGRWRLMAFWLVHFGDDHAVNHIDKGAMQRYCERLGSQYLQAFGGEFGKTVESLFQDSFEVPIYRNGIYWAPHLLGEFKTRKGYDLTRLLPALWWEVDRLSPKVRYDVNEFLHRTGMEAFFDTFLGWCERNGVKGRIQPYGFVTDILEGAGRSHIPELEITAGEKDAVPWFDPRIGPRTYTASGAHLYGRNVVSVEAYTYMHWQPGRSTMEELKIASDMFLRAGANKFYNSGFTGTPEKDFAPSRRFYAEIVVSPVNVWWRYYRLLGDYVARCSSLLRQGRPAADIAVYSPLANQWTLDVLNARRWTRDFDWGALARILLTNGYDFDLINDDVLQNRSDLAGGHIRIRDLDYRILVLPNIRAIPLATFRRIEEFIRNGGIVVALEQTPSESTGMAEYEQRDAQVRSLSAELFREPEGRDGTGPHRHGRGYTFFIRKVIDRSNVLDFRSSVFDPFLITLRKHLAPDFGIDFVREGIRENQGLVFSHRKTESEDIYFVSNVQDRAVDSRVAFRVSGRPPEEWNPYDGSTRPLHEYSEREGATMVPVRLAPYESTFIVFTSTPARPHAVESRFARIVNMDSRSVEALAGHNGVHTVMTPETRTVTVDSLPAPFEITGDWKVALESEHFRRIEKSLPRLVSWTEDAATRHFSGTGVYSIKFHLPAAYARPDTVLQLDLGDIGNIGDVEINGKPAGVVWMRGQRLDVTRLVQAGGNRLVVKVTNTLLNRIAGMTKMPPLAPEFEATYGRGLNDDNPAYGELLGFEPLPRSGLLGPVRLVPFRKVRIAIR
ncbi:MAG: glycosyl hydrolase [Bryobacteraceae bacterium]